MWRASLHHCYTELFKKLSFAFWKFLCLKYNLSGRTAYSCSKMPITPVQHRFAVAWAYLPLLGYPCFLHPHSLEWAYTSTLGSQRCSFFLLGRRQRQARCWRGLFTYRPCLQRALVATQPLCLEGTCFTQTIIQVLLGTAALLWTPSHLHSLFLPCRILLSITEPWAQWGCCEAHHSCPSRWFTELQGTSSQELPIPTAIPAAHQHMHNTTVHGSLQCPAFFPALLSPCNARSTCRKASSSRRGPSHGKTSTLQLDIQRKRLQTAKASWYQREWGDSQSAASKIDLTVGSGSNSVKQSSDILWLKSDVFFIKIESLFFSFLFFKNFCDCCTGKNHENLFYFLLSGSYWSAYRKQLSSPHFYFQLFFSALSFRALCKSWILQGLSSEMNRWKGRRKVGL